MRHKDTWTRELVRSSHSHTAACARILRAALRSSSLGLFPKRSSRLPLLPNDRPLSAWLASLVDGA